MTNFRRRRKGLAVFLQKDGCPAEESDQPLLATWRIFVVDFTSHDLAHSAGKGLKCATVTSEELSDLSR